MTDPTSDPKNTDKHPEGTQGPPAAGPKPDGPGHSAVAPVPGGRRWWWLLPALTFLIGLVLGGVVIGATRSGSSTPAASPTQTQTQTLSSGTPAPTGAEAPTVATVVVPAECLKVAQDSQLLVDLTKQAAAAARDLDAAKLSDLVRQIDTAQTTLREHAASCQSVEASISAGTTPSETMLTPTTP